MARLEPPAAVFYASGQWRASELEQVGFGTWAFPDAADVRHPAQQPEGLARHTTPAVTRSVATLNKLTRRAAREVREWFVIIPSVC
jgi:hypothetical protein